MKSLVTTYMLTLCIAFVAATYRPPPRSCSSFVKEHIGRMYAEITSLKEENSNLKEDVEDLKDQVGQEDILSAFALYGNFLIYNSDEDAVVFKGVNLNIGDDYNSTTGLFTTEYPGTYVFTLDLVKIDEEDGVRCQIEKNGVGVAAANVADNAVDGAYYGSSVTTILELDEADVVRVTCNNGNISSFSAFSGFLLRAD